MTETKTNPSTDLKGLMAKVDAFLTEYLTKKAPSLPENAKEAIVKYSPYIALVFLVLALPALLAILGISAFLSPMAYLGGVGNGLSFSIAGLVLLASLVVEAIAIPGLFSRKKSAWNLMYYSTLVNAVYQLLQFNLGSLIIGTGISLYILFQVRSFYKN